MAAVPERHYYYRGLLEKRDAKRVRVMPGYSPNGESGGEIQPWMTIQECREEARRDGVHPVFRYDS